MTWAPSGDRLAYIARFGKSKGVVIEDVVTRKVVQRIDLPTVNEPESPCYSPDGKSIVFSALQNAKSDIFMVTLATGQVTNLTQDPFYNYGPVFAPDGQSIVYLARVSGNEKLFRLDLVNKKQTQITFGTHDDTAARFLDADTIVFASTAVDPAQAIDPEVARNANIYNIWTLGLKTGELKQYTDSLGGNLAPVILRESKNVRVAFITYYKGSYGLHTIELSKPLKAVATRGLRLARARSSTSRRRSPTRSCPRTSGTRNGSRRCTWRADRASRPASPTAATSSAAPRSA